MHRPTALNPSAPKKIGSSHTDAPVETPKTAKKKERIELTGPSDQIIDSGKALEKTTEPTHGKKDLSSGKKLANSPMMLRFEGAKKKDATWDESLVRTAKELRADAALERWKGTPVEDVAKTLTKGSQDFMKGVIDRALSELALENGGDLPADFPKDYTILGCGSFSRGEMCPHSDMDVVLMAKNAEEAPKLKPLQDKLANLFKQINGAHGGFNIDDVSGQIRTPETFAPMKDYAFETKPLFSSSAEGAKLYDTFREKRDAAISSKIEAPKNMTISKEDAKKYGVGRPLALNTLAQVVGDRWKTLESGYKQGGEVNIKELQSFVSNAGVRLAEFHDATGRGTTKHLDGSTIDRLKSLSQEGGTSIGKLLSKAVDGGQTLGEALIADYAFLMDQRYNAHTAHRSEHDKFIPTKTERARLDQAMSHFGELHAAVMKLVAEQDRA